MIDSVYWIWVQTLFGFGTARSHKILQEHESPEKLYEKISSNEPLYNLLYRNEKEAWKDAMEKAKRIKELTLRKNCQIITPDHPDYPPLLQHIYAKPAALYVKGDISILKDNLNFTIVGTRRNSKYGAKVARSIAVGLAANNANVISGLAFGIDSISHEGALEGGGKTVGVLACGLDIDYPRGNLKIKTQISENGAVVSEYPMSMEPRPHMFPPRNRIMSGMSHGVVVVEAGDRSGALITAGHALEYGREVFAAPGSMFAGSFAGSHKLIREGQAKLIISPQDILEEYGRSYVYKDTVNTDKQNKADISDESIKEKHIRKKLPDGIEPSVITVYEFIDENRKNADQVVFETGVLIDKVLGALTTLELLGFAQSHPGGYFTLA